MLKDSQEKVTGHDRDNGQRASETREHFQALTSPSHLQGLLQAGHTVRGFHKARKPTNGGQKWHEQDAGHSSWHCAWRSVRAYSSFKHSQRGGRMMSCWWVTDSNCLQRCIASVYRHGHVAPVGGSGHCLQKLQHILEGFKQETKVGNMLLL